MRALLMILLFGFGINAYAQADGMPGPCCKETPALAFATNQASPIGCEEQFAVQATIRYINLESSIPATESFKYCSTQYSGMALATITFAFAISKERSANPGNLALRRLASKSISDAKQYQSLSLLFRKKMASALEDTQRITTTTR
ncbi:MAG: hypothetical protein Q8P17_01915 [bacterium]|nr:hypothetical protein [bacterium]